MTYSELAMTFDMLAKHKPDGIVMDWISYDEYGFDLSQIELSASEIRMLALMGWNPCSDEEYDEEEMAAWYEPETASDEELVEIFNQYKSISKCV